MLFVFTFGVCAAEPLSCLRVRACHLHGIAKAEQRQLHHDFTVLAGSGRHECVQPNGKYFGG